MLLGYLSLIIGILMTLASVLIATSATQLSVTAFSTVISLPAAAAVVTGWIAGGLCLLAYRQLSMPKLQSEKILQTWDKQDTKLAAEIQSDKEKQLLAKIQTLETALDKMLKKKKED
ncbi:MAG TPA: hypothetical protein V6C97_36855 [Oculatellaceae cyanobacterium]